MSAKTTPKTVKKDVIISKEKIKIHDEEGLLYILEITKKEYSMKQNFIDGTQIYDSVKLVKDAIKQVFKNEKSKKEINKIYKNLIVDAKKNIHTSHSSYTQRYNEDDYGEQDGFGHFHSTYYEIRIDLKIRQLNPPKIQISEREFNRGDF